jgi:hypothetical protein
MLAMLKGLSSGGGGGGGDDDGGGGGSAAPKEDNRPLEERLDDSNWAVRKKVRQGLSMVDEPRALKNACTASARIWCMLVSL